ncbi:hypothetical protein [Phenylobacterium sp.]|uniref:hypothetical protein n=1 Tax=Phenylobacterium sp. TaxID=1871053 RepID=UPI00301C235B
MTDASTPSPSTTPTSAMPWPFAAVWLGDHLMRDYARFWSRMATAGDPVEAAQAEATLGADVLRDWAAVVGQMWLLPMRIWATSTRADGPKTPEA